MEHDLVILSPEKTLITYRLASIGSRIIAHLVDVVLVAVAAVALASIAGALLMPQGIIAFLMIGFVAFYFILLEGLWNGQTLGKKAAGLRVRMADGTAVTFSAALGRNLLRPADMLPAIYFLGLLAMFTTPKSQRLGDLVANTVVLHERLPVPRFAPAPHTAGIHPIEESVGDLRGMTIEEYNALRRFCDRFYEPPEKAQRRLLADVWRPIAVRRGIPDLPHVHPLLAAEAVVMRYGRQHGLL